MRLRGTLVATASLLVSTAVVVGGTSRAAGSGLIVYDKDGHIWSMHDDGSRKTDLTPGWTGFASDPSLSADGTRVAFAWTSGGPALTEIYSIPAAPTIQSKGKRLTDNAVQDADPAWSPDGTRIAFTRNVTSASQPQNYEIFTMKRDGSSPVRLTHDGDGDTDGSPSWSPNGSHIAFRSTRVHELCDDGDGYFIEFSHIYVMTSSGGSPTDVTDQSGLTTGDPAWSPDGARIAFDGDLWTLGPDNGSGPTCVSNTGDHIYVMSAAGSSDPSAVHTGDDPAWSPDGTRLAYIDGVAQAMATMDPDGTDVTSLAENGRFPSWGTAAATKVATKTTLTVRSRARLKAHGTVKPNVEGQTVTVTLYRKSAGVFKKIVAKPAVLDVNSEYRAAFAHPRRGTCKVTARYHGDARHLASSKSVTTSC